MIAISWPGGRIEFKGFELPEELSFGGSQALVTHKLIGGRRVVDAMGPDDAAITWQGRFLDEFASLKVFQLDLLRRSGREVQLAVPAAHRAYRTVVSQFTATMRRPYLYDYSITLEIVEDQVLGDGGAESRRLEDQIALDIAAAETYAAGRDAMLYWISIASMAIRAAAGDRGALRGLGQIALAEAQGAVGQAVFEATGTAVAANVAVAAVAGVGGVVAGGDPEQMALNFAGTAAAAGAASSAGLAAAHMTRVQTNIAAAPP